MKFFHLPACVYLTLFRSPFSSPFLEAIVDIHSYLSLFGPLIAISLLRSKIQALPSDASLHNPSFRHPSSPPRLKAPVFSLVFYTLLCNSLFLCCSSSLQTERTTAALDFPFLVFSLLFALLAWVYFYGPLRGLFSSIPPRFPLEGLACPKSSLQFLAGMTAPPVSATRS